MSNPVFPFSMGKMVFLFLSHWWQKTMNNAFKNSLSVSHHVVGSCRKSLTWAEYHRNLFIYLWRVHPPYRKLVALAVSNRAVTSQASPSHAVVIHVARLLQDSWRCSSSMNPWSWLLVTGPTLHKEDEETVESVRHLWWICLFSQRLWLRMLPEFKLLLSSCHRTYYAGL